jgi:predicted HicB family RNase H-like nuclease
VKKAQRRTNLIGVRVTKSDHLRLQELAEADQRTLASLIHKILHEYLERLDHDQGR